MRMGIDDVVIILCTGVLGYTPKEYRVAKVPFGAPLRDINEKLNCDVIRELFDSSAVFTYDGAIEHAREKCNCYEPMFVSFNEDYPTNE